MSNTIDINELETGYEESQDILISFIDGYNTMKRKFSSEISTIESSIAEINLQVQSYSQYADDDSSVFSPFSDVDQIKDKCEKYNKEIESLNSKKAALLSRIERIDSQIEQLTYVSEFLSKVKNIELGCSNTSETVSDNTLVEDSTSENIDSTISLEENYNTADSNSSTFECSASYNGDDLFNSIAFIEKILPADPFRAKIQLREILNKVSRET